MPDKKYKLSADQIETLVEGMGASIATDRITVDGCPVGYMYREPPDHQQDSGWRFFAGDESQEYNDDAGNLGLYSVNTIVNYDRDILPFVRASIGSAFAREGENGEMIPVESPVDPDKCLHPDFPVVSEEFRLSENWSVYLPRPFNRRIEEKSMVLWRPGLTIYFNAFGSPPGLDVEQMSEHFKSNASSEAYEMTDVVLENVRQLSYRLIEDKVFALYTMAMVDTGMLEASIYFDRDEDIAVARKIADSMSYQGS